jgi:hypothetical protein
MVPALRLERIGLHPKGGANVSDFHVMPGIAFLIRANLKAVLVANIERAGGFPVGASGGGLAWDGGAADWGSLVAAPKSDPGQTRTEFESIQVFFAWAM